MVVGVVGMEEEMEGRMVEELVVKMEGKVVENGWPKEGAWLRFAAIGSVASGNGEGKKNEREREKERWVYIKGGF